MGDFLYVLLLHGKLLVFGNSTVIFPFAKKTFSNIYLFGFVKLISVLLFRVLDIYLFFKANSNRIALASL